MQRNLRQSTALTPPSNGTQISGVIGVLQGTLYIGANDGITGTELWATDSTTAGTKLVKDIKPGSTYSPEDDMASPNDGVVSNNPNST